MPILGDIALQIKKWATSCQKKTKWHVCPAKTQISLGIRPVWSESSLCTQWVAKDPSFLHADSKDSDQTGQMPRLIKVFAGRTCHFVGFVMRRLKCWYCNYSKRPVWANTEDPDFQKKSNQGQHCLPFPLNLLDAKVYWKNTLNKC